MLWQVLFGCAVVVITLVKRLDMLRLWKLWPANLRNSNFFAVRALPEMLMICGLYVLALCPSIKRASDSISIIMRHQCFNIVCIYMYISSELVYSLTFATFC